MPQLHMTSSAGNLVDEMLPGLERSVPPPVDLDAAEQLAMGFSFSAVCIVFVGRGKVIIMTANASFSRNAIWIYTASNSVAR
jgi:hypothetical protein